MEAIYTGAFTDRETDQFIDYADYIFVGQYLPYYICDGSVTYPGASAPSGTCQAPNMFVKSTSQTEVSSHEIRLSTDADRMVSATVGGFYSTLDLAEKNDFAYEPNEWIGNWPLFYWAWWISWSPFVGMFIARISRGRTIREFILGVLLVPSGFTFLWLTIFGNSGLWLEMHEAGAGLATAVQTNMPTAIFVLLDQLPLTGITSALATMLIVTFFVTSSDSGSLVIDIISSGGAENPPVWQRIFWAVSEGAVAATLLVAGGLAALQTAAISSALPLIIVMFLVCYGLMKALHAEPSVRGVRPIATSSVPVAGGSKAWQSRLKAMLGRFKEGEAQAYLETTARQAMEEVLAQLTTQNILHAGIEAEENLIRLTAGQGEEFDFLYEIKLREYSLPSVAFPELPTKKSERNYWRAEVTLLEGAQQYDVAGYSKEELMSDILTQFENHLHLLHTDI